MRCQYQYDCDPGNTHARQCSKKATTTVAFSCSKNVQFVGEKLRAFCLFYLRRLKMICTICKKKVFCIFLSCLGALCPECHNEKTKRRVKCA